MTLTICHMLFGYCVFTAPAYEYTAVVEFDNRDDCIVSKVVIEENERFYKRDVPELRCEK